MTPVGLSKMTVPVELKSTGPPSSIENERLGTPFDMGLSIDPYTEIPIPGE